MLTSCWYTMRVLTVAVEPDEDTGPVCLIALVATGRPLRPVRRVVRIGLVATDGSRYLQSGTICPAICYRYLFGVAN